MSGFRQTFNISYSQSDHETISVNQTTPSDSVDDVETSALLVQNMHVCSIY